MILFFMFLDSILEDFLEIVGTTEPLLPSPTRTPKKNLPLGRFPAR